MLWPEVTNQPTFPEIEHRVLDRWRERGIVAKSFSLRAGGEIFSFYEGPPTANGEPGTHHAEARAFKDVFPRYRTMKGYDVPRKAGWDCHGLPVELEVEKALGLNSKAEIERFGIEAFNQRCRESVLAYVSEWVRFSERLGFWVDFDDAYRTMDPSYIDAVWWAMKRLADDDLIFEDHRVTPYCARCGTGLSDAEVAQGYAATEDPSIYVRLPIREGPLAERGAALLIWTTTPWTIPSNAGVVIGSDVDYVLATPAATDEQLVVARDLVEAVLGEDAEIVEELDAADLLGLHYEAPFEIVDVADDYRFVLAGEFVSTKEGTGLVHIAPAFGADDLDVGRRAGLPVINPVDGGGRFTDGPWAGQFVKDADPAIVQALEEKGALFAADTYEHTYPFCWRCDTPLIYRAKLSWYIRTTARREELLASNREVDWHPAHIRDGRFGNWLANNVDWALSRDRYWGTPLPFWRCAAGHVLVVGSRAELAELAGSDLADLDPHRPYVDKVMFDCPTCGATSHRVPEVADAWFDSGAMPFAQFGYPYAGADEFHKRFPADFICEAIDQTRGWFYTLLAESTLLFGESSYRTVLCLGHIVDEDGRKMSKSLGNVINPWDLFERSGADALRWLMLTEGSPWLNRRVGHQLTDEVVRRVLLTLWNTHYFFLTYARLDGWTPDNEAPAIPDRPTIDRWLLAELAEVSRVVDASLDGYDASTAGRHIERFIDDLSNWYVRRTRRRFWRATSEDPADKSSAYATLHTALRTLAGLIAPFMPFIADELYEQLVRSHEPSAPESVHLTDFPAPPREWDDPALRSAMATARHVVELGRQARNGAGVKIRQPLASALVTVPEGERTGLQRLLDLVSEELNIKEVRIADRDTEIAETRLRPNFRALGPAFQSDAPRVAELLRALEPDAAARVATELETGAASVDVDGSDVVISADMVEIETTPRTGWHLAEEAGRSVAIDLDITEELRHEGLARDLVRVVNDRRKELGLDLDARIDLTVRLEPPQIDEALAQGGWFEVVAREVLAGEITRDASRDAAPIPLDDGVTAYVEVQPG